MGQSSAVSILWPAQNDPGNRLTAGPASASFAYDPAGRLSQSIGAGVTTRFLYDGAQIAGEYDANGALLRRYVPGPGLDEPVVWYEGSSVSDRRFLAATNAVPLSR